MDPGIWYQIGLKFIEVHIKGAIESQRCCDRGNDLSNQPVQILVSWSIHSQVVFAHIVDSLIINQEANLAMLHGGMSVQNCIVRLDYSRGYLFKKRKFQISRKSNRLVVLSLT